MDTAALDRVLEDYQRECAEKQAHYQNLHRYANNLVNGWAGKLSPILAAMNQKLKPLNLEFHPPHGKLGDKPNNVGATLSIRAVFPNRPKEKGFLLSLRLSDSGSVEVSFFGSKPFEVGEIPATDEFPEAQLTEILAQFAGHCLRQLPSH